MSSISLTKDIKNSLVANGTAAQTKPTISGQVPNITSTDTEIPAQLQSNIIRRAANIRKLSAIEQFNLDKEWTEYLQTIVEYGNKHLLKGFQYRLIMEEV